MLPEIDVPSNANLVNPFNLPMSDGNFPDKAVLPETSKTDNFDSKGSVDGIIVDHGIVPVKSFPSSLIDSSPLAAWGEMNAGFVPVTDVSEIRIVVNNGNSFCVNSLGIVPIKFGHMT